MAFTKHRNVPKDRNPRTVITKTTDDVVYKRDWEQAQRDIYSAYLAGLDFVIEREVDGATKHYHMSYFDIDHLNNGYVTIDAVKAYQNKEVYETAAGWNLVSLDGVYCLCKNWKDILTDDIRNEELRECIVNFVRQDAHNHYGNPMVPIIEFDLVPHSGGIDILVSAQWFDSIDWELVNFSMGINIDSNAVLLTDMRYSCTSDRHWSDNDMALHASAFVWEMKTLLQENGYPVERTEWFTQDKSVLNQ